MQVDSLAPSALRRNSVLRPSPSRKSWRPCLRKRTSFPEPPLCSRHDLDREQRRQSISTSQDLQRAECSSEQIQSLRGVRSAPPEPSRDRLGKALSKKTWPAHARGADIASHRF